MRVPCCSSTRSHVRRERAAPSNRRAVGAAHGTRRGTRAAAKRTGQSGLAAAARSARGCEWGARREHAAARGSTAQQRAQQNPRSNCTRACAAFRVEGEPGGDVNAAGTAFEAGAPALSLSDDPYSKAPPYRSKRRTRVCSDARTPRCPANPPGPVLDPSQNSGTPGGPTTARDPPLTSQPPGIHR